MLQFCFNFALNFNSRHYKQAHFRLDPPLFDRLPARDSGLFGATHKTCALVGNSGLVLGSKWGAEIDAHDAVMRINYPPVDKWGPDVGAKTTYDFSNRENARRLAQTHVVLRDSKILFFEVGWSVSLFTFTSVSSCYTCTR